MAQSVAADQTTIYSLVSATSNFIFAGISEPSIVTYPCMKNELETMPVTYTQMAPTLYIV